MQITTSLFFKAKPNSAHTYTLCIQVKLAYLHIRRMKTKRYTKLNAGSKKESDANGSNCIEAAVTWATN